MHYPHLSLELPVVVDVLNPLYVHVHVLRDVLDAHVFVKLCFNLLKPAIIISNLAMDIALTTHYLYSTVLESNATPDTYKNGISQKPSSILVF